MGDSPTTDPSSSSPDVPSRSDPASLAEQSPSIEVLRRALAGDETAFAELYVHLHPRLHRYAMSIVGQDADDVTAEAWLQIARDLRQFKGDVDDFRGWTARIVRNRAMDHLRGGSRRPAVPVAELPEQASPEDTAANALERMSTDAAVAMIASLPREQAEAVMLRAVVGLDAKQSGQVLGKSAAAVRVSAHRGLKRLAALLEEGG